MKEAIETQLGTVNILVNCAGGDIGASGGKPNPNNALDVSYEDIKVLTENNLRRDREHAGEILYVFDNLEAFRGSLFRSSARDPRVEL